MDIGALFLIVALAVLVGLFVGRPFFMPAAQSVRGRKATGLAKKQQMQQVSHLMAEQERILNALQELDFDNSLGKIPADDYPYERQSLMMQGADVLRQLDELQEKPASQPVSAPAPVSPRKPAAPVEDVDIEALIAQHRRKTPAAAPSAPSPAGAFCSKCGKAVQKDDRFCFACGAPVARP